LIDQNKKYDVFICHASEDKESVATPLANALVKEDLKVWYDTFSLGWGDKLMKKITDGIKDSKFGIVILSPKFFEKKWPQLELDVLVGCLDDGELLPLLYNLTPEHIKELLPLLSRIISRSWDNNAETLAKELKVKVQGYQDKVSNTNNYMKYHTSTNITEFSETNYFNPKEFEEFKWGLRRLDPFTDDSDRSPMPSQHFVNLFKLMRECNLKVSEIINLKKGDFDFRHNIIMIRYLNSDIVQKTIIMPKDDIWIQKFLLNYNDEDKIFPINSQTVYQYAKDACRLAGLTV